MAMTPYSQHSPEERRAWKAAQNRAYRISKGATPRPPKALRASILERHDAKMRPVFVARVRELDDRKTHLGRYPTREEAERACAEYIATGIKPPPGKRGPKTEGRHPWRRPAPVLLTDHQARPLPTAERLARIAAKTQPSVPATARLPVSSTPITDAALKTPRIASQRVPAMTPEQRAERLENIRRIATRWNP